MLRNPQVLHELALSLSTAAPNILADLGMDAGMMGIALSAFFWSYILMSFRASYSDPSQVPGGAHLPARSLQEINRPKFEPGASRRRL